MMYRLAMGVAAVLLVAGCGAKDKPADPPTTLTVTVDTAGEQCQPPGAPGNCWLPLFVVPVLGGGTVNESDACSNKSHDQSSCWPQPGTDLTADCLVVGADKRPWYGFLIPASRVLNKQTLPDPATKNAVRVYAAVQHLAIKSAKAGLPSC